MTFARLLLLLLLLLSPFGLASAEQIAPPKAISSAQTVQKPSFAEQLAEERDARREAEHRKEVAETKAELVDFANSRLENWIGIYGLLIAAIAIVAGIATFGQAEKAAKQAEAAAKVAGEEAAKEARSEVQREFREIRYELSSIEAYAEGAKQKLAEYLAIAKRTVNEMVQEKARVSPTEPVQLTPAEDAELTAETQAITKLPETGWTADQFRLLMLKARQNEDWKRYADLAQQMALAHEGNPDELAFALFGIAYGAARLGQHEKAANGYETFLQRCPSASANDRAAAFSNWGAALAIQATAANNLAEADRFFDLAGEKFQNSLAIIHDDHEVFFNWGKTLSMQAQTKAATDPVESDRLWGFASAKYQAALEIKSNFHEALRSLGRDLLVQAAFKTGLERSALLDRAEAFCVQANHILPGSGSYNLACISGIRGDAVKTAEWLRDAKAKNVDCPDCAHLATDTDFDLVRETPEFQQAMIDIGCAPAKKPARRRKPT